MPGVIITGASGLLGRAIYAEFKKNAWDVLGFAFTRARGNLVKIDLHDTKAVWEAIEKFAPDAIIHCAAERSPDKVEKDYEASRNLNVNCSKTLAHLAGKVNAAFLYISTDYVFDGKNPPYKESDEPKPLNQYGISKLEGEKEVMKCNPDSCILRIPVLYGGEEYIGESAISFLLVNLLKDDPVKVSNFEVRFPSSTSDIASVCLKLIDCKLQNPALNSVFHYCGREAFTKYEMTKVLAEVLGLRDSHILPDDDPSPGATRPKNTQMSCERLKNLGIGQHTDFKEGVKCYKHFL